MKYLVIGLGNLGRAIAKDLTRVGNEVIGVDMDLHRLARFFTCCHLTNLA